MSNKKIVIKKMIEVTFEIEILPVGSGYLYPCSGVRLLENGDDQFSVRPGNPFALSCDNVAVEFDLSNAIQLAIDEIRNRRTIYEEEGGEIHEED